MTTFPEEPPRSVLDILADLLDLIALADRQLPCHRYVSTARIRDLITAGLVDS